MIEGPRIGGVHEVDAPVAAEGQVVVDVERVGVCGTDVELFTGEMTYLQTGDAVYPLRIGHEWCGTVRSVGAGVDEAWLGRRVMGDTMLGCGRCRRCRSGRQHLCADRYEVGIRHGWAGALAEQLAVPASSLHGLPDRMDDASGALVEPGGNAWRAVDAAGVAAGGRLLVLGAGAIGLLVALMARARGAEVHLVARREGTVRFTRSLGFEHVWRPDALPAGTFDGVVDASNAVELPALAIDLVEPGGRVVWIGLSGQPQSRRQPARRAQGRHGRRHPERLARPRRRPRPVRVGRRRSGAAVAAVVGLDEVAGVLAGNRDPAWGDGPKVHVDPRR